VHAKQHHTPHAGELKTPFRDAQHPRMFHRRDAAHDAVSRAISTAQLLSPLDASARPCGIAVASPVRATTTTNAHAHGYARGRGELRSPLAMIDANSPQGKNTKRTNASSSMPAPRGGFEMRVRAASKLQRKPSAGAKSRLARSRSASEESLIDDANGVTATVKDAPPDTPTPSFRAVESFDEMVNRLRLTSVMDDYATRELALVYEESLEARSLRAVLENVKDSELEMAHVEAERRDKWAKSIEENIERKWASKVREMEKENAKLRVEAHSKDVALDRAKTEANRLAKVVENAPRAAATTTAVVSVPEPKVLMNSSTQTTGGMVNDAEVKTLKQELTRARAQTAHEQRQGAKDLDMLNADLVAKEKTIQTLRHELSEAKDRAHFYERCVRSADERANNAEATSHALREEIIVSQGEFMRLKEQMLRSAANFAEEKESIMAALAAAQARANEVEQPPVALHLKTPEAWFNGDVPCSCGSVRTAKRLSAALADATSRNTELQTRITMLESKLEMRLVSKNVDVEEAEEFEERALAAERRASVAREALTRYVHESQKCSPAPTNYSTIDALTPMKEQVTAPPILKASHESAQVEEDTDSDEFDSPQRHRGTLPTPRLRARVAIRLTHGPAPKHSVSSYRPSSDDELRRRAKIMGLSMSPFSRNRH
jgi:hypothetical protein